MGVTEASVRPLGEWLRQRREELGISLEDAQEATRIRIRYLEALEGEDFEALPNAVVTRGFLRNYADYLEMDAQEAADRFARIAGPAEPESPADDESSPFETELFRPVALHKIDGRRRRWWLLAGLLVILAVALGWLAWMGYPTVDDWLASAVTRAQPTPIRRVTSEPPATVTRTATTALATDPAPMATLPATVASGQPTPTLEIGLTPTSTASPSPSPSPTEPIYTGIFLELVFTDTSWIQVTADGVRQFQGELEAGTYQSWYAEQRIELRIGNAGVVEVTVNGQELGTLGEPGEVVDRIFEIVDDRVTEATPTTLPPGTLTAEATAGTLQPEPTLTAPPATVPPITSTPAATPPLTVTVTVTTTPTVLATASP